MSMEFSRQEYWCGGPFLSPGNLPNLGIKPWFPTLQADSLLSEPPWKAIRLPTQTQIISVCFVENLRHSTLQNIGDPTCLAPERIHGVYTLGLKFQVMKRLRKFEKVKSNTIINIFHSLFFLALKKSFFLGISFPFKVYIN